MAEKNQNQFHLSLLGLGSLPFGRQLGVLIGFAASIALAGTLIMWFQKPMFSSLYTGLSERDVVAVTDALQKAGIPFEAAGAGSVLVPKDRIHDARLKLAAQGLPNSTSNGFELLDEEQGFGTSQFMEKARYQRALEGELGMTISNMRNVESARIHLALPKASAFIRNQKQPSASVFVNLYPGRNLDEGQVAAISHLVAASIPNLELEHVAIIDEKGRLLSSPDASSEMGKASNQFSYRKRLEDYFIKRIETLLTPIVGIGGVRAQVTTELDFTVTEQTQESFNPDLPAIRSEQTFEEEQSGPNASAGGVPGALTNQPPEGGTVGEPGAPGAAPGEDKTSRSNRQITRNYELDRTVSHVRMAGGTISRLSVAVIVDDKQAINEGGEVTRTPLSEEELGRITTLVKEAVGFSVRRGDTVSVLNTSFTQSPPLEPLPEPPLLEQAWIWEAGKIVGGILAALLVALGVLKPLMRSLAEKGSALPPPPPMVAELPQMSAEQLALAGGQVPQLPGGTSSYDTNINTARNMVQQDPKRVATVVRQWVSEDG